MRFEEINTFDKINEGGFKDTFANIKDSLKGDQTSQGKIEARKLKNQLKANYERWIGRTGKEVNEKSLMQFLVSQVNFTPNNARELFKSTGLDDPTSTKESIITELDNKQLDALFQNAANFAFANDLVDNGGEKNNKDDDIFPRSSKSKKKAESDPLSDIKKVAGTDEPATGSSDNMNQNYFTMALKRAGLSKEYMEKMIDRVDDTENFVQLEQDPENKKLVRLLSIVGYSLLKSMNK